MKTLFIVGTDTGVGKSVVTGMLGRYLLKKGYNVITQKWVETGTKKVFSCDIATHARLMGIARAKLKEFLPFMSPYIFKYACSPHLAAALEKKDIRIEKIKNSLRYLSSRFDFVIVEGAGGALVPLSKSSLLIDIVASLNMPTLIVAENRLGAINHALLTAEAIKRRGVDIVGIIFNNSSRKTNRIILKDNPRIVKRLSGENVLGALAWRKDAESLYKIFVPIGRRILSALAIRGKKWITG